MFQSSIAPKGNRYFNWWGVSTPSWIVPILDRPEEQSLPAFSIELVKCSRVPILDRPEGQSLRYTKTRLFSRINCSNPRSPRRAIATILFRFHCRYLRSNPRSPRRAIATRHCSLDRYQSMFQSSIAPKGNRYRGNIAFIHFVCRVPILDRPEGQSLLPDSRSLWRLFGCSNPRSPRRAIATRQFADWR